MRGIHTASLALLVACSSSPSAVDAGSDASVDAAADVVASNDAAPDVTTSDASKDAPADVVDAGCVAAGTPSTVFSGAQGRADLMVVDGPNVYWTHYTAQYDTLYTCPIASCTAPMTLTYTFVPTYITSLAVDANEVWFIAGTSIYHSSKTTFDLTPPALAPADSNGLLAIDANAVYWTNPTKGTVQSCPKSGCTTPTTLAQNQTSPFGIATDGTNVYWTNAGPTNGAVMKCATSGCALTPTQLVGNQAEPERIATDGTNVYWIDEAPKDGTIESCPITGCASSTSLAIGQPGSFDIATDGANVYWSNVSDGLFRCATSGCAQTPTPMTCHNVDDPVALDATRVYWTDLAQQAILSLPK